MSRTTSSLERKAGQFFHLAHEQVGTLDRELQKAESQADNLLKSNLAAQEQLVQVMESGGSEFYRVYTAWTELAAKRVKLRSSIEELKRSLAQIIKAK